MVRWHRKTPISEHRRGVNVLSPHPHQVPHGGRWLRAQSTLHGLSSHFALCKTRLRFQSQGPPSRKGGPELGVQRVSRRDSTGDGDRPEMVLVASTPGFPAFLPRASCQTKVPAENELLCGFSEAIPSGMQSVKSRPRETWGSK